MKDKAQGSRLKAQINIGGKGAQRETRNAKLRSKRATRNAKRATVVSVNISERKTVRKKNVGNCVVLENRGLEGDAHAGDWHRQVSLLAEESIEKMQKMGLKVGPGDFAENITTRGIDLVSLPIGTQITIGDHILLEVSQIGKECHTRCAIYYQAGDCVMPREGIFAKVLKGGEVKVGDSIEIKNQSFDFTQD